MQAKRESEPQAKAAKIDGESEKEQSDDLALMSLDGFHNVKILRQDVHHKTMFVQANIDERPGDAVVIVEKTAFTEENVKKLLSSSTKLKFKMSNDIYRQYDAYPPSLLNSLQTTVIYPASDELLAKLGSQESFMVEETPRLYETITKKFIEQKTEDMQWVYNILDHKAETERTVFDDPDPETGFVLISDLKWDGKTVDSLYLLGICYARGIRCLRDLSTQHLPLLKNMLAKGRAAIEERYGLSPRKVKVYVHYHPSYYHFHVHYVHIMVNHPGGVAGRAHLLQDVIDNIEHISTSYYQDCTLTFCLRSQEVLWEMFEKSGSLKQ